VEQDRVSAVRTVSCRERAQWRRWFVGVLAAVDRSGVAAGGRLSATRRPSLAVHRSLAAACRQQKSPKKLPWRLKYI